MASRTTLRLDVLVVDRGLAPTRARARALILAGRVFSGENRLDKPGVRHPEDTPLRVSVGPRYVGRGGDKLEGALHALGVRTEGLDALDVGASTGGFTDALLTHGARRVIALDVGRGQLDWGLRNDPRVHVIEGYNARYLSAEDLPYPPLLAVVDVSFISLRLVLPAIAACLAPGGEIVALVKPQFEVGRGEVGRGGIVRDAAARRLVLERICVFADARGWPVRGIRPSVLRGADGNQEYFVHLARGAVTDGAQAWREQIDRALAGRDSGGGTP